MSRKSEVWNCFIKTSGGGKCKFCHKELKSCGNTTNLMNHLIRKHGFKRTQNVGSQNSNKKLKSNNSGRRQSKLPQSTASAAIEEDEDHLFDTLEDADEDMATTLSNISGDDSRDLNSMTPTTSTSTKQSGVVTLSQKRIQESFSEIESFKDGGSKSIKLTEALMYMIVKDNLPLNSTEKEGFQYFIKKALPHFQAPGRTKITQLIDDRHEVLCRMIKERLSSVEHVSVTSEVWTDTINTRSFLGATVHFIHDKRLCNLVICLKELTETHTSEFLTEILLNTFSEWRIPISKIRAIITDNGANIVKAVTSLLDKNRHLPCFSHTLNLVAQKICDEENVAILLSAVKAIVTYFKHSVAASDELRKVSNLKLIQSVVTRWNSSFLMLQRFLKLRDEIGTILLRFPKSPRMLTAAEIQEAQEVINLLKPIEAASREICGDHYVTASKIIPIVNMLHQQVLDLNFETQAGQSLKNSFLREMAKRFGKIEEVHLLAIATLMDARFKRIHFKHPLSLSQALSKLRIICEAESQKQKGDVQGTQLLHAREGDIDYHPTIDNDNMNIWSFHEKLVREAASRVPDSNSDGNNGLKHYLNQPVIDIKEDPIEYWDKHKITYPVLSKVAHQFLSIVGTSVPSERLFSAAGNVMDPNRNRLTPTRLSNLVFLRSLAFEDWHLQ